MSKIIPLTLEWFSKKTELLVDQETLCIDLDLAINLIEIDKNYDPIIAYSYKVSDKIAKKLQQYYTHGINLKKFNYFFSSYSDVTCPQNRDQNDSQ